MPRSKSAVWPPWSDKLLVRVTASAKATLGFAWKPPSGNYYGHDYNPGGFRWSPVPNVTACVQARIRFYDFIDADRSQCTPPLSVF
jgi:hypothetical protein